MSFDINQILTEMAGKIKTVIEDGGEEISDYFVSSFKNNKTEFEKYAMQRIKGEISERKFKYYVEQRMINVENDILAATAYSKAIIQKAVNSALDVFYSAIEKVI